MKIIQNKLLVLILSFFVLCSCKNDQKISKKENVHQNSKVDNTKTEANRATATLFSFSNQDNTEIIKISGSEVSDDDKFYLVGDKNVLIVAKYKKNKKNLKLIQKDTLLVSDYNDITIDQQHFLRKKTQGEDYFLFAIEESPLGNGDHSLYLSFMMLNIKTLKLYTLKYIGVTTLRSRNTVDGEFSEDLNLDHNITIKNELYQFANQSKWIYKPTEKEKDINYYKNFEEKWHLDNYPEGKESLYPSIIKSTYYAENLFEFNGNYSDDEVIENADFKIVTYFRHNIIGYDKNKKLYFPIIAESCASGCGKKIEFLSKNEIEVLYEMDIQKPDIIDLNKIQFENSPQ